MVAAKSSRVNRQYKKKYRIRNWREYERGLRSRGDVTIWLSEDAIAAWIPPKNGLRGGQRRYSNLAVRTALTLRVVFSLPLRQTEGFLDSLLRLMGLNLKAPDHTTLSRRNQIVAGPDLITGVGELRAGEARRGRRTEGVRSGRTAARQRDARGHGAAPPCAWPCSLGSTPCRARSGGNRGSATSGSLWNVGAKGAASRSAAARAEGSTLTGDFSRLDTSADCGAGGANGDEAGKRRRGLFGARIAVQRRVLRLRGDWRP